MSQSSLLLSSIEHNIEYQSISDETDDDNIDNNCCNSSNITDLSNLNESSNIYHSECPICLESVDENSQNVKTIYITSCNHKIHYICFLEYINNTIHNELVKNKIDLSDVSSDTYNNLTLVCPICRNDLICDKSEVANLVDICFKNYKTCSEHIININENHNINNIRTYQHPYPYSNTTSSSSNEPIFNRILRHGIMVIGCSFTGIFILSSLYKTGYHDIHVSPNITSLFY